MLFLHLFGLLFSLLRLTSAPPVDPPSDDPPPERTRATDVLARYGDNVVRMAEKVAELESDLYKTRRSRDDYKRQSEERGKTQTPEGAVVLTGDDASQYQAINLKPADIATRLKDAETVTTELAQARKAEQVREVATVAGWKPDVLTRYGGALDYEIREVDQNGTKVKQAFVKDGETVKPVTEHFADLVPALQAEPTATRYPAQHSGDTSPKSLLDQYKDQREKANTAHPNPLLPTQG